MWAVKLGSKGKIHYVEKEYRKSYLTKKNGIYHYYETSCGKRMKGSFWHFFDSIFRTSIDIDHPLPVPVCKRCLNSQLKKDPMLDRIYKSWKKRNIKSYLQLMEEKD